MSDSFEFIKAMAIVFPVLFVIAMFAFYNRRIDTIIRFWLAERDTRTTSGAASSKSPKENKRTSELLQKALHESEMHKQRADDLQARLTALEPFVDRVKLYPDLSVMQVRLADLDEEYKDLKRAESHLRQVVGGQLLEARLQMATQLLEEVDIEEDLSELVKNVQNQWKQQTGGALLLESSAFNEERSKLALSDEELTYFVMTHINFIVADALESRTRDPLVGILEQVDLSLGILDRVLRLHACVKLGPNIRPNRIQFVTLKYQEYMRAQAKKEEARELREKEREEKIVAKQREAARKEAADKARQQEELKAKVAEKEQEYLAEMRSREEQLKHVSLEQKAVLQAQISSMEALHQEAIETAAKKYAELEESRLRKQSLAEQTTQGYIYIISNTGSFGEHVHKIGMTRREDPEERVRELSDASVPFNFKCHALVKTENAPLLENTLHSRFASARVNKVNSRKEFFKVSLDAILKELKTAGHTTALPNFKLVDDYALSLAKEKSLLEIRPEALELGSVESVPKKLQSI